MFVSPRFRDIFSPKPIRVRKDDSRSRGDGPPKADAAVSQAAEVEEIWLNITAAHRRSARVFTPASLKLEELASDDA